MTYFSFTTLFVLAVAFGFQASPSAAFTTTSQPRCQTLSARNGKQYRLMKALNSSPDPNNMPTDDDMEYDSSMNPDPSMSVPETPPATYVPPTPTRNSPPAVRQQRMDPLMASLTKDDSIPAGDQPTQTVPIFGEIPADGTLLLLAPAVVFAVLGFLFSFVIAFNSADQIVDSIAQTGDSIAQTAQNRNNRVYDKDVCRGLCSSQQEDVDGMRNFMEAITRSAREKQAAEPIVELQAETPSPIVEALKSTETAIETVAESPVAAAVE